MLFGYFAILKSKCFPLFRPNDINLFLTFNAIYLETNGGFTIEHTDLFMNDKVSFIAGGT